MRSRKWISLLLVCLLVLGMATTVQGSELGFVADEADILTASEEKQLADAAERISSQYGCGIYIVTVWDYHEYGSSVRLAAENYFLDHGLGLGVDDNGVLLLLSMAERDYALIAHGDLGNSAFTDYGKELLCEEFLDDFRYDSWYAGFADYLSCSEEFLSTAASGEPVDVGRGSDDTVLTLVLVLLVPALIAGIVCGIMAASMKTASKKTDANDYIQRRGIRIDGRHDRFLTRTVVRQKIESSSSSGGGTRVGSRGFSGRSGKF